MVLQEPLKCLFGLLVFDSGLLFLFLLCLHFVGIEGLFLLTQFGKGTLKIIYKEGKIKPKAPMSHCKTGNMNSVVPVARIVDDQLHCLFPRGV